MKSEEPAPKIIVRLSAEILDKLRTTGLTAAAAAGELLGVGPRQADRLLKASGAIKANNAPLKWHLP